MPARTRRIPSYRLHKPTGQAVVRIDGRDHYLGKHGTPESREKYDRVVAEWLTAGVATPPTQGSAPAVAATSVNEVILGFLRHADAYYRRADGTPTGEADNFKDALRPLRQLYGRSPAAEFGPLALKAVRQAMIDAGLARTTINARLGKVVRVFKWAVENELVPASVHHGLKAVPGLRKGRSGAPETGPVRPVPDEHVEAIRPHVAPQVWAMVELQRLTGMRPGEATILRAGDLDRTGPLWEYVPGRHKAEHHGKERRIVLGPRAQEVVRPWLREDPGAYLFQPREAVALLRARRVADAGAGPARKRPRKRKPRRAPGECYRTRAYAHAIHKACRRAGVPVWGPNRLRHNAATRLRKEFGLDVARAVLGHSDADTTTIYAERDAALAADAMARVG